MKLSIAFLSLAISALSNASVPGTLLLGIQKREIPSNSALGRTQTLQVPLINHAHGHCYYVNISIGTPSQNLSVDLDTGSSDLWFPASGLCSQRHSRVGDDPCSGGSFDSRHSTTFENITDQIGPFEARYADGSKSIGDYFTDTLIMGEKKITNFTMGLSTLVEDNNVGIFGIGNRWGEKAAANGRPPYANGIDAIFNAGLASSHGYSLWLDDLESSSGSILFGGVDSAKYFGDLISLDVLKKPIVWKNMMVPWTSYWISPTGKIEDEGFQSISVDVALDSGSALTTVPLPIANYIEVTFGSTEDGVPDKLLRWGAEFIPCSFRTKTGYIKFGFGKPRGPIIQLPMSELVVPWNLGFLRSVNHKVFKFTRGKYEGEEICKLSISASLPGEVAIFGDTFLRSAYVVYDLANDKVALAQTNFDATGSNVVPFEYDGAPIPSVRGVDIKFFNPSNISWISGTSSIVGPTGVSTPGSSARHHISFTPWELFGITCAGIVLVSVICAAIYCLYRRMRTRRGKHQEGQSG